MSQTTIVVFSDPANGGEEAFGRMLNALFLTQALQDKGTDVALVFQGAGTRWPVELVRPDHPANALYRAVQGSVAGVCGGCADAFGASADLSRAGIATRRDREVPGVGGIIDLSTAIEGDWRLVLF